MTVRSISKPIANSICRTILKFSESSVQKTIDPSIASKSHAIYATKKVVQNYAGNAVKLKRVSDSTEQDFAFQSDGTLDSSAIETFRGASTLRVSKLYDQSGAGLDLTPPASTNAPGFRKARDGNWIVCFKDYANFSAISEEYLQNTGGSFANRDIHVIQCGRWNNQSDTQPGNGPTTYQIGFASATDLIDYNGNVRVNTVSPVAQRFRQKYIFVGGTSRTMNTVKSGYFANANMSVAATKSTASGIRIRHKGYFEATAAAGTNKTGLSGIRFGASFGTSFVSTSVACFFMVSTALSDDEEDSVATVCKNVFGASVAPSAQVVCEGDSISAGYNGTLYDDRDESWPILLANSLGPSVLVRNLSISSAHFDATADGGTASLAITEQSPDKTDPLLDSAYFASGKQLLVIWAGTNDLFYKSGVDGDAEAVHTRLQTYCNARTTAGWKVLVVGPIPRGPFSAGQDTELAAFNDLIALNYTSYANGFVDMLAQNWTPSGSYATNYLVDEIHPNATGRQKAMEIIKPYIQSILGV